MMNWTWDGKNTHQMHCDLAFLPEIECSCINSARDDVHCMPDNGKHDCTSDCWCVPEPEDNGPDGVLWVHREDQ